MLALNVFVRLRDSGRIFSGATQTHFAHGYSNPRKEERMFGMNRCRPSLVDYQLGWDRVHENRINEMRHPQLFLLGVTSVRKIEGVGTALLVNRRAEGDEYLFFQVGTRRREIKIRWHRLSLRQQIRRRVDAHLQV